jgi:CHAD domain-containing protein
MSYRLNFDEDLSHSTRRTAHEQLDQAAERLGNGASEDPVAAVHDARKNLKKARSLLRLVQSDLDRQTYRRENRAMRDAGREVSDVRDADVMVETLDKLRERFVGFVAGVVFDELIHRFKDDAKKKRDGHNGLALDDVVNSLRAIAGRVDDWALDGTDWRTAERGVAKAYKRGRKAFKRALAKPTTKNLHELRKRVKDIWYHDRLLRAAWPVLLAAAAKEAHALSDRLGDDHDLALLDERLRGLDAPPAAIDEVLGLVMQRRDELLDEIKSLGHRIYAETPKAFRRRLREYLKEAASPAAAASPSS